jgi:uncharacterized protein (DUF302 family)
LSVAVVASGWAVAADAATHGVAAHSRKSDIVAAHYREPVSEVLPEIRRDLVERHFKVLSDIDILHRLRAGEPKLARKVPGKIQAENLLVVCQAETVVGFLRENPSATSLCPLSISLVQKRGETTAYYARRSPWAPRKVRGLAREADAGIRKALRAAALETGDVARTAPRSPLRNSHRPS